jgi:polyadenylate-binding protein 2
VHYSADKKEIEEHFADCGEVKLVTIVTNKMTHQPQGFCYIEFNTIQGAQNALALDGSLFKGRLLTVHQKRKNIPGRGRARKMGGMNAMMQSMMSIMMGRGRGRGGPRGRGRGGMMRGGAGGPPGAAAIPQNQGEQGKQPEGQ